MSSLSTAVLAVIFAGATACTWLAGIRLSGATDALDRRYHLGEDIGGMVLLAIAGTLPEIAITVPAALGGHLGLAAGNLIGGIAVQTMVLVVCDLTVRGDRPLTYLVGSLMPVLEALLVLLVTAGVLMGGLLPGDLVIGPISPASLGIVIVWLGGIALLSRVSRRPQWQVEMPGSQPGRSPSAVSHPQAAASGAAGSERTGRAAGHPLLVFALASAITLGAGVILELAGNELANRAQINGVLFGATVLSLASALPEISSGVAAVRLGDHRLAVGDIFGGNAFQVCLFLVADLLAGRAVLPASGRANSWLAIVGCALTAVYAAGVIIRPSRRILRLGGDSIVAIVVFALGIAGLVVITR